LRSLVARKRPIIPRMPREESTTYVIRAQFFPRDTARIRSANSTIIERYMNPSATAISDLMGGTAISDLMSPTVIPNTKNATIDKHPNPHSTHMIRSALSILAGRFSGPICLVPDWGVSGSFGFILIEPLTFRWKIFNLLRYYYYVEPANSNHNLSLENISYNLPVHVIRQSSKPMLI
jgi:hypothetical protein